MKHFRKIALFVLLFLAAAILPLLVANGCTKFQATGTDSGKTAAVKTAARTQGNAHVYTAKELQLITRLTARTISENHYRQQGLTPALSQQFFDEYFKTLDPGRIFFTTGDIARFEPYRMLLGDALKRGDNSFCFQVYDLYRQRMAQYKAFAEELLKKPFDFTVKENYLIDRSKAPRPADEAAMRELWRKRIKNDVLYYRLLERVMKGGKKDADLAAEAKMWGAAKPEEKVLRRLRDVYNGAMKREQVDILGLYLDSLAKVYGPHSNYASPKFEEDFNIQMSLSLTGIGATLTSDGGFIKIVDLVAGGPAALDGRLKVGDRIIAVTQENGESVDVIDMPVSKAVEYIRGPEKSKVTLTVLAGAKGRNSVPQTITITRAKIVLRESEAKGEVKVVDGVKVGVIDLPGFYFDFDAASRGDRNAKRCSADVMMILRRFEEQEVAAVVLDLRRNGGGSLYEAVAVAGLFLPEGPVVQVRTRDAQINQLNDTNPEVVYAGPLLVLTSKLSASSSEIVTSALRDANRAIVVGDSRTFGKGTVLEVRSLDSYTSFLGEKYPAGAVTFETSMFFRPRGGSVQQLGIAADIRLPSLTEELQVGEMFLDNHLPWDSIPPCKDALDLDPALNARIATLRTKSEARMAKDPKYAKLRRQIALYQSYKDRKEVSLNEEERFKEYNKEKLVSENNEEFLGTEDAEKKKKSAGKTDAVLDEALRIAADYAKLR